MLYYTFPETERSCPNWQPFQKRQFSRTGKEKSNKRQQRLTHLEDMVKDTEERLGKSPSKQNEDAWNVARSELEEQYDIIAQGIIE